MLMTLIGPILIFLSENNIMTDIDKISPYKNKGLYEQGNTQKQFDSEVLEN